MPQSNSSLTTASSISEFNASTSVAITPLEYLSYFESSLSATGTDAQLREIGQFYLKMAAKKLNVFVRMPGGHISTIVIKKRIISGKLTFGRQNEKMPSSRTVCQLISLAIEKRLKLKAKNGESVVLQTPLVVRQLRTVSFPSDGDSIGTQNLPYFHGGLVKSTATRKLSNDGAFLVYKTILPGPLATYRLAVRGGGGVVHKELKKGIFSGGYEITNGVTGVTETVRTISEWIQVHRRFGIPVDGNILCSPVMKPTKKAGNTGELGN